MSRPIPPAKGYRVDRISGTVHDRYAAHALHLTPVRKVEGIAPFLGGRPSVVCDACWPDATPKPSGRRARGGRVGPALRVAIGEATSTPAEPVSPSEPSSDAESASNADVAEPGDE